MAKTVFSASSRYELDEGGLTSSRIDAEEVRFVLHVVQGGDTVENLAYRLYGDAMRWWEIADLNPQLFHAHRSDLTFTNLIPGDTIRVPV